MKTSYFFTSLRMSQNTGLFNESEFSNLETSKPRMSTTKKVVIGLSVCVGIVVLALIIWAIARSTHHGDDAVYIDKGKQYDPTDVSIVDWNFTKSIPDNFDFVELLPNLEPVKVPHTWNNLDGQDGGSNYYRGACAYQTVFTISYEEKDKDIYVEFFGVFSIATVYLNGFKIGKHVGGFSMFRFNITEYIYYGDRNVLTVVADNSESNDYYPIFADFTFFGGIYRNVNFMFKPKIHFDLSDNGTYGVSVTTAVDGNKGNFTIVAKVTQDNSHREYSVRFTILNAKEEIIFYQGSYDLNVSNYINNPHLWDGRKDPYLYTAKAVLVSPNQQILDTVIYKFGFRSFACDHEGFYINGVKTRLHGVSRHQDRLDKGWAVSNDDEIEDFDLISEMGANAVRLAHYQQNQSIFDICDRKGIVVWVEVPLISQFSNSTAAHDCIVSMLTEMIKQNSHHPCIAMWGIMNEVGMYGETPDLMNQIKELNQLAKKLDSTRLTSGAMFTGTPPTSEMNTIPDIIGYNLYYGWYMGNVSDNSGAIDAILNVSTNPPLSLTEYGAECNIKYHSDHPVPQDYSEEYQLQFHMEFYKIIEEKDLWGSYVWNMFDFAADARDEGGVKGRNNKGLVTYDRKIKKDSFYFYKAMWSTEPFVHVCGMRFHDRPTETINVTIISNQKNVNISLNDQIIKEETNFDKYQIYNLTLKQGKNYVKAVSGSLEDVVEFEKVDTPNPDYELNITDDEEDKYEHPTGFFSVLSLVGGIIDCPKAFDLLKVSIGQAFPIDMLKYVSGMKLIKVLRMAGAAVFPEEKIQQLNAGLNKIPLDCS